MKRIFTTGVLLTSVSIFSAAQNVGVGTGSPLEKLHVAGNVKADTVKPNALRLTPNAGTGKVLTSDATGNASWQQVPASSTEGPGSWGDCSMNGVGDYQAIGDTAGAEDDYFGYKVSISGDMAIVSAPFDDIGGNVDQGSVSFLQFNGSGWEIMQKFSEAGGSASDYFGADVAISGNYAVIGVPADDIGGNLNQGSVMIYHYNGINWVFLQKITDPTGQMGDFFGISVSISGSFLIVGASMDDIGPNTDQGSACIFQFTGATWTYMQKINDQFGATEDYYGTSVSISGQNLVVGEPGDDVTTHNDQGAVLFYYFNGSTWVLRIKLTDAVGDTGDNFGNSVSISGNNVAIASPLFDWTYNDEGAVNIYRLNGNTWEWMQRLLSDEPETTGSFGYSLSMSGNYLMVGSPFDNVGTLNNKGSATIYEKVGIGWSKLQFVHDKMGTRDDEFGASLGIDGNTKRFAISSYRHVKGSGKIVFGKVF